MNNTFKCNYCEKEYSLDDAIWGDDELAYCGDCKDRIEERAKMAYDAMREDQADMQREHEAVQ